MIQQKYNNKILLQNKSFQLAENQATGTTVFTVNAADGDSGDNGVLTYSIIGKVIKTLLSNQ